MGLQYRIPKRSPMTDVHTQKTRSFNMSRIKAKDTKPEIIVRKFIHSNGFRYGLHNKKMPGTPDIILRKYKTVIFVHGCFWHKHENCKYQVIPKTRADWWLSKIDGNVKRDMYNEKMLNDQRWKVIKIWECELKPKKREDTLNNLHNQLIELKNSSIE